MCTCIVINIAEKDWPVKSIFKCFSKTISVFCSCSSHLNPDEWTVFLGEHKQKGSDVFEASLGIVNITLTNLTGTNIALLQLENFVNFSSCLQPICVDLSNDGRFPPGTQCWVTGWGNQDKGKGKKLCLFARCWKAIQCSSNGCT